MTNVKLRADALDDLELPVRVKSGHVGVVRVLGMVVGVLNPLNLGRQPNICKT